MLVSCFPAIGVSMETGYACPSKSTLWDSHDDGDDGDGIDSVTSSRSSTLMKTLGQIISIFAGLGILLGIVSGEFILIFIGCLVLLLGGICASQK